MDLDGSLLLDATTLRDSFAPAEKIVCWTIANPNSVGSWQLPYAEDVWLRGWLAATTSTGNFRLNTWDKGSATGGEFTAFGFASTNQSFWGIRTLIPAGSTLYYHEGTSTVVLLTLILELTL